MRLNLSSQIVLNKVPEEFYKPKTAVDRSEITRMEKIPTDIFPKMEEAVCSIVDVVVNTNHDSFELSINFFKAP